MKMDDYITTDTGIGIYGYLNLETNEIDYVGQTSMSFRMRDRDHRKAGQNRGTIFDYKLRAHPDKYIMIPLAYCDDVDSLNLLETFYIYYFNTIDKDNYTWGGDTLRGKWHPSFRNDLDDEEIRKLYIKGGLATYQIGEKFRTNATTISRRLKKQGIKVQDKNIRDDLDDEEIKKLYVEEGLSTYQIGKKLGINHGTIYRRLKKQGVKLRGKGKFKNTSNYYRVYKKKTNKVKQGFVWAYEYPENNKQKQISSVNFETLKKKVQEKGLPWHKIHNR